MKNLEMDPFMPEGQDGDSTEHLLREKSIIKGAKNVAKVTGEVASAGYEELSEYISANHERWIRNAKEGSVTLGVLATRFGLGAVELSALVKAVEHTAKGEFHEAVTSVGTIALANVARKIVNYGVIKGMPEDWTLRQRDIKETDEKTNRDLSKLYDEDPKRAKSVIEAGRKLVMDKEGDDFEKNDRRADYLEHIGDDPRRIEEAKENFIYWDASEPMELYRDDPEKRIKYLRILGGYVREKLARLGVDESESVHDQ